MQIKGTIRNHRSGTGRSLRRQSQHFRQCGVDTRQLHNQAVSVDISPAKAEVLRYDHFFPEVSSGLLTRRRQDCGLIAIRKIWFGEECISEPGYIYVSEDSGEERDSTLRLLAVKLPESMPDGTVVLEVEEGKLNLV